MSVTTPAVGISASAQEGWLRSREWDLKYISLSVVLVAVPYLAYLALTGLAPLVAPFIGGSMGASPDDVSRNLINGVVALLVGGPHMYATFTRTALDHDFAKTHKAFVWSSLLIPMIVIALAVIDIGLLLTVFFFWASIHVLHQIIYITELYNHKQKTNLSAFARYSDYAVILTSLYPLAAWKISTGAFTIGPIDISAKVASIISVIGLTPGPWMIWLAGGAFTISLVVWLVKTIREVMAGTLHGPKTLFISLTITAAFFVPILGNLDTAFQGMNVWHSFQYLALTWVLNNLRAEKGQLDNTPFVKKLSEKNAARTYYLFNIGLTLADVVLAMAIMIIAFLLGVRGEKVFAYGYYIAVLSFLWMHYYHDHFLFSKPEVITT
jgi:hypothetical protein